MRKCVVFILFVPIFLVSCAKKKDSYRTEVIDGVTIVHNLRITPNKAYKDLTITEDLVIGVEEGEADYMLYSPVDIDADLDGNIYVLDQKDALIKKYDEDGFFIGNIGRKGQGPGEFDRPNQMEIASFKRIIVADPYQRRFEFLAMDGSYIKSVRMEPYVTYLECGTDGSILVGYSWSKSDGTQEYRIGCLNSETGEIKDLFVQKQYWPARLMNDQLRYDFPYFVRAALDSQSRIYVGVAIDYEVSVLGNDGELEFKFLKAHDKIPVKGEMLEQITNITLKGPNPYVKNPYFPVFESLSIDEQDNIWIQHHQPKWAGKIKTETVCDVFSSHGIFQFTTKIPGHILVPLKFKNGCIYSLRLREEGFIEAVRIKY